ncbi:MAG TPA: division plane positioning ATPase MipZ [Caulobacterales bacterium]|nr:division plane positioning ATPase MipZ [Caulobacterales bacterium]
MTAGARGLISPAGAHVIVVGAEKQAAGKTTIALHLATALARAGRRIGVLDLDSSRRALSRFVAGRDVAGLEPLAPVDEAAFVSHLRHLSGRCAYVVIDTSHAEASLTAAAHACADTLVTVLTEAGGLGVAAPGASLVPSAYSDMVWDSRKQKAQARGAAIDWVVLRNRAASGVDPGLTALSSRIGFRAASGLSERPILRDLFAQGRTLLDAAGPLNMAHIAARQELRELLTALKLPDLRSAAAA